VDDVEQLLDVVPQESPDGALVLMLGAGSITSVAHRLGKQVAASSALAR
jgi:UDP-N-acetylmuramate-alanine ligase